MRKIALLISIILLFTSTAFAVDKLSARAVGMGGAFSAVADDSSAIFLNPAGIGYVRGDQASVTSWGTEGKGNVIISGIQGTPFGCVGVGFINSVADLDDSEISSSLYDYSTIPVKELSRVLVFSFARELNEFMIVPRSMGKFSLGVNLKFSNSRANNVYGAALSEDSDMDMDFALLFKPTKGLSVGFSLQDIFEKNPDTIESRGGMENMFAAGVSGRILNDRLIWSVEKGRVGCEFRPLPGLALRGGKDGSDLTVGIGLNLEGITFDYAIKGRVTPVHYIGVTIGTS